MQRNPMFAKLIVAVVLAAATLVLTHTPSYAVYVFVLAAAVAFVIEGVRIVPQQSAWVVERLGQASTQMLEPGLNFIVPFFDRVAYRHSLKEVPLDVPEQVCITKDNTQLAVDGIIYYQVTDPRLASYGSSNYITAIIAARADHAAQRNRQDGTRQDLRVPRRDQPPDRQRAGRGGPHLGRQGAALRDQEPHAARGDPARDAGSRSPPSAKSAR